MGRKVIQMVLQLTKWCKTICSRPNKNPGSAHLEQAHSETPLNRPPLSGRQLLYLYSLQYLTIPWMTDTTLLCITGCSNCTQTKVVLNSTGGNSGMRLYCAQQPKYTLPHLPRMYQKVLKSGHFLAHTCSILLLVSTLEGFHCSTSSVVSVWRFHCSASFTVVSAWRFHCSASSTVVSV